MHTPNIMVYASHYSETPVAVDVILWQTFIDLSIALAEFKSVVIGQHTITYNSTVARIYKIELWEQLLQNNRDLQRVLKNRSRFKLKGIKYYNLLYKRKNVK